MEKSSFAMAKFGLEPKEAMPKRDCGFYVKYVFLFTSLIQFLIILGLVLFMVYGNVQAGTDTHLRLLEEKVQSHYSRIVSLGATNANLSRALNATLKDKDKLQGLALKAQRELEKCNSSQASTSIPQVNPGIWRGLGMPRGGGGTGWAWRRCRLLAEKLQLQQQLDQATSSKKTLEENGRQCQAELAKATQERDRCQQDLQSSRTEGDYSRTQLQLQRHECNSLQSDVSDKLPRISELVKQFRCGEAEKELRLMRERAEGLLRRQQERDSRFVWRDACELSVRQCRLNCSREEQELQRRIQGLEKREKDGAEERKRLEAEKEKAGKELEEKRRVAAAQAESLREQLGVCMGAKVGTW
ncbi:PLVAP protein, partial [Tichodroma muraria]|nr:PLVAP protein [Tichodroma muraria]